MIILAVRHMSQRVVLQELLQSKSKARFFKKIGTTVCM